MLVESIAITCILVVMVFIFLRAGKKQYAVATAPLLVVPFMNVLYNVASEYLKMPINIQTQMLVLIISLAVAVLLIGFLANAIKAKKYKLVYIFTCGGFTTLLTVIFLYNLYLLK